MKTAEMLKCKKNVYMFGRNLKKREKRITERRKGNWRFMEIFIPAIPDNYLMNTYKWLIKIV